MNLITCSSNYYAHTTCCIEGIVVGAWPLVQLVYRMTASSMCTFCLSNEHQCTLLKQQTPHWPIIRNDIKAGHKGAGERVKRTALPKCGSRVVTHYFFYVILYLASQYYPLYCENTKNIKQNKLKITTRRLHSHTVFYPKMYHHNSMQRSAKPNVPHNGHHNVHSVSP